MATITTGSAHPAVTQSTNASVPAAMVVALTDGDGNLAPLAPTGATFPLAYPSAARSAANTGDTFDTTALTSLAVDVNVTAFTGGSSPAVTFFVERLAADNVWYRIWTSGALSTATTMSASIGRGLTGGTMTAGIGQGAGAFPVSLTTQARLGWSFTGTPTSITFSASVASRP